MQTFTHKVHQASHGEIECLSIHSDELSSTNDGKLPLTPDIFFFFTAALYQIIHLHTLVIEGYQITTHINSSNLNPNNCSRIHCIN